MADSKFSKQNYDSKDPGFEVSGKKLKKQCQPCMNADRKTDAKHECLDCAEYMCTECSAAHTRFSMARDHKIATINNNLGSAGKFVHKVNLKLLVSIDLKQGDGNLELPYLTSLGFLPDGRLVAVDAFNDNCVVYNEQLAQIGLLHIPVKPIGVVVISADEVAITTGAAMKIYFLHVSKSGVLSFKRARTVDYNYQFICMMRNDTMLATTYADPQHARVISLSGKETELGITFPLIEYHFYNNSCSYIENCNKVVVSNKLDNNISIYNLANNEKIEVRSFDVDNPSDVVIGPNDDIFLCCNGNSSLIQITHSGEIVRSYKLSLLRPVSIGISKDKKWLAVSNGLDKNRSLQLFEIQLK